MKAAKPTRSRPDILGYHDYRTFLKDWLEYRKTSGLSLRALAREAGMAVGYLPMVLSGTRTLTPKAIAKLAKPMGLTPAERQCLELLVTVADSDSQEARREALDRLQRSRPYRERHPRESETYRYLSRWHTVAIREMAALPDFRADAKWIQQRLRARVSLGEVEEALRFLLDNGFLQRAADGTVRRAEKDVTCVGGVYRVALANFHRQMLYLTAESLGLPAAERTVMGHTLALPEKKWEELNRLLNEALDRAAELERTDKGNDMVYHVLVSAIPLTRRKGEKP